MADIVWWEIETRDSSVFQSFSAAMWGWTFTPAFADTTIGADYWVIVSDGEAIGGLQHGTGVPTVGTRVYLEVADLEATLAEIEGMGGTIERARTALGGDDRWFATFVEPTGVSMGLWTSRARE